MTAPRGAESKAGSERRVLIVDDDRDFAESVSDLIAGHGNTTRVARSAEEAVTAAREFKPHVILLDVRLGTADGMQIIPNLRHECPDTSLIIMTAYPSEAAAIEALRRRVYDFLRKPIDINTLLASIERCFEQRNLLTAKERAENRLRQQSDQLVQFNRRLQRIVESMRRLAASESRHQLDRLILDEFARNFDAGGGSMYRCWKDALERIESRDKGHAPERIPLPLDPESVFGHVLRTARPVFVRDISEESDLRSSGYSGYTDGSLLVFPMLASGGEVGELVALHNPAHPPFSRQDVDLGVVLAAFCSEIINTRSAAEALREAEEKYREVFRAESDAIVIYDEESGRLTDANDAAESLFAYPRAELLRLSVGDLWLTCSTPDAGSAEESEQCVGRKADGSVFPAERSPGSFQWAGKRRGFCVIRDISRRVALEEQLLHAQKMEAIGRLAGGVAHDFNNILTAINGYAELLLTRELPDDVRDDLDQIHKAGRRASALTRQLLAFSRRQPMQAMTICLNRIVRDTERMLERVLGEDIALCTDLAEEVGMAEADPAQIEQVLLNLAVNARDSMPDGGTLTLTTSRVTLDEVQARRHPDARPGEFVRLSIADTGVGMDAFTAARAFEPFFTTKPSGEGTGLGLSMAYGIVRQSEGWIEVESEPDAGATFHIYFPRVAAKAEAEPEPPEAEPEPVAGGATILIVEDETVVRNLAQRVLERNGYRVLVASGGAQALELCGEHGSEISLMLTDVVMPKMNGPELVQKARASYPGIPVMYMSGYADETIFRHIGDSPPKDMLRKPFTPGGLLDAVRRRLRSGPKSS